MHYICAILYLFEYKNIQVVLKLFWQFRCCVEGSHLLYAHQTKLLVPVLRKRCGCTLKHPRGSSRIKGVYMNPLLWKIQYFSIKATISVQSLVCCYSILQRDLGLWKPVTLTSCPHNWLCVWGLMRLETTATFCCLEAASELWQLIIN